MSDLRKGVIGTAAIVLVLLLVFNYRSIPGWPGTDTLVVEFADASGIATGDSVQMSGIVVGEVRSIELAGADHVDVAIRFDPNGKTLGDRTSAAIKVETALGKRYVEVQPSGSGELGDRIPLARTTSGFDLTDALSQVSGTLADTDKATLSDALGSISGVMESLPPDLAHSLDGLTSASNTIADRDEAVRELVDKAGSVTGVLSERNQQLTTLLTDGSALFAALNERADTVRAVLVSVKAVSDELSGLVDDNRAETAPMLAELQRVLDLLNANYDNIDKSIQGLGPFVTQLGEAVGSGPFFSVLLQNILPANLAGQVPGSPGGSSSTEGVN